MVCKYLYQYLDNNVFKNLVFFKDTSVCNTYVIKFWLNNKL